MADPARPLVGMKIQFGPFLVDVAAGELRKYGVFIKLQERPLRLLLALLERPGEVVTREELRQRIWPDGTFVDFDHNISSCANKLRGALNDTARNPRYIETVGSRGYRFIAECRTLTDSSPSAQPSPPPPPTPTPTPAWHRPWMIGVRIAMIALCGFFLWSRLHHQAPAATARPMLAVLPFSNLTGDPTQEYFSDGLTEEMITRVGQFDARNMGVIARTSVMRYKDSSEPLSQIGRELGVDYVLEGSVRRSSGRVRVTAQLIKVSDQGQLWSKEFTSEEHDILNLQDEITHDIAAEIHQILGLKVTPSQRPSGLSDREGYEFYLKGRYSLAKRTVQGMQQSVDFFQQAIAKNPNDARSYAALADSYALMSGYYLGPPDDLMPKAKAAALKAIELDPNLSDAHTSLAVIAQNYDWDWQTTEREYLRAIDLDPNNATAHHWYAEFLVSRQRFDEAFREIDRARRLDPASLIVASDYGVFLHQARQYDRAIQQFRSVLDMEPGYPRAQIIINTFIEKGMYKEAFAQYDTWKRLDNPSPGWLLMTSAILYGRSGDMLKAQETLTRITELNEPPQMKIINLAVANLAVGNYEKSIDLLEQAYQQHSPVITFLGVDPTFDPLRSNPRFQSLLKKIDIPNHHQ